MGGITDEEYDSALKVWNIVGCNTLFEYHRNYLIRDVLILSDVINNFRDICIKDYGLDPSHYISAPGLGWDAMMKMSKIEFELLTDSNMFLLFERAIRGGITQSSLKFAKANNKYMTTYNPNEESSFIKYLDVNSLYPTAMSLPLPYGGFEWYEGTIEDMYKDDVHGYLVECDVIYPIELHDEHNDLPFLSEKVVVNKIEKLIPNLNNKYNYVCNLEMLKQAQEHGLKVVKYHNIIKFNQSCWMKSYIDFNVRKRTEADINKDKFGVMFYKLMMNSVFGKTMENARKYRDIHLCTTKDQFTKW